jgi:hypothetical protein
MNDRLSVKNHARIFLIMREGKLTSNDVWYYYDKSQAVSTY